MNVYDFDKTIYRDDSSMDFYRYNLKQDPTILRFVLSQGWALLRYKLGILPKTAMKQVFYRYFRTIEDMDQRVSDFWELHEGKLQPFYLNRKLPTDVIISASPEFLLKPLTDKLGIRLIASRVDRKTGEHGENCYGVEKVRRFREIYPAENVEAFYSDSLSDTPMADLAKEAYLVIGDILQPWPR